MTIGHNTLAGGQLKAVVERIEHLEDEKREVAGQIKEVYAEAKAHGFDAKVLRKVIAARKRNAEDRAEEEAIFDMYWHAIGMEALE